MWLAGLRWFRRRWWWWSGRPSGSGWTSSWSGCTTAPESGAQRPRCAPSGCPHSRNCNANPHYTSSNAATAAQGRGRGRGHSRDIFFGRVEVDLYDDGAVDLLLDARRRVLAAHSARLVKHVRGDSPLVGADEHLQRSGLLVSIQLPKHNRSDSILRVKAAEEHGTWPNLI